MSFRSYKLRGEFGDAFFEGTNVECEQVKKAMIKYGIAERKLTIVYPKYYEFSLPDGLREQIRKCVTDWNAEGRNCDSSYVWECAEEETYELSDHELYEEYSEMIDHDDEEEDTLYFQANDLLNTFKLEEVLSEEP